MIREDVREPRGYAGAGDESAAEALWRERRRGRETMRTEAPKA